MQILKVIFIAAITAGAIFHSSGQLQSPDEFLPYQLGDQFTPHHLLVDYFEHVAAESPNVQLIEYGRTNEHRPLKWAFVSTVDNLNRLEEIRTNNLKIAGLMPGEPTTTDPVSIVWLGYSVHGNEAAGSEASMRVVHNFASNAMNSQDWLQNTVVIIDPSINPDGYNRYSNWNNQVSDKTYNADGQAREHDEPWPGGRVNHYLFDLNRDWAWQTQVESQQRLVVYNQWMPHVVADIHEMGAGSPYYFAPAAQPFHEYITEWQRDFQETIGKNHAKYFDAEGWRYFTKQVFDLFYPSYGDTYSTYNGAIGMTYEQGGGSRGARALARSIGDTLTLRDRIAHHTTTSMSTVEVSAANTAELVQNFETFFTQEAPGEFKSFVIKHDNAQGKIKALCKLLDRLGIRYGSTDSGVSLNGVAYGKKEAESFVLEDGDLVISANQPRGAMTQILFEPEGTLVDSMTYDITAWALPFAYGLEGYALRTNISVDHEYELTSEGTSLLPGAYAYALKWESLEESKILAAAFESGLKARVANKPFTVGGNHYSSGTVLFMRSDNRNAAEFANRLENLVQEGATLHSIETGFVDSGDDFGSSSFAFVDHPKVLTLSGESVSPYSYGQIWYFFEQVLDYPITSVNVGSLGSVDWTAFNTLVLPEGYYRLSEDQLSEISQWVRSGGKVIALGSALNNFGDKDGFALKAYAESSTEEEVRKAREQEALDHRLLPHNGENRRRISNFIPGAVVVAHVDTTHPMGYGVGDHYFTLKTSTRSYEHLTDASNALYLPEDIEHYGFIGSDALAKVGNTIVVAEESKGRGSIIYMVDNPLFRGFWVTGQFLFTNALFFAGN